jgi:DNA-binding response OmpR family regulator
VSEPLLDALERAGLTLIVSPSAAGLYTHQADGFEMLIIDDDGRLETSLLEVAKIRATSRDGIILLAESISPESRLLAFSLGVDHLIEKPANPLEIIAIVRNLARHYEPERVLRRRSEVNEVWSLDRERWLLITPENSAVNLSPTEFQLMFALLQKPGISLTRDQLNNALGTAIAGESRNLDALASKLRRKVERVAGRTIPLRGARNAGYVFAGAARIMEAVAA